MRPTILLARPELARHTNGSLDEIGCHGPTGLVGASAFIPRHAGDWQPELSTLAISRHPIPGKLQGRGGFTPQ